MLYPGQCATGVSKSRSSLEVLFCSSMGFKSRKQEYSLELEQAQVQKVREHVVNYGYGPTDRGSAAFLSLLRCILAAMIFALLSSLHVIVTMPRPRPRIESENKSGRAWKINVTMTLCGGGRMGKKSAASRCVVPSRQCQADVSSRLDSRGERATYTTRKALPGSGSVPTRIPDPETTSFIDSLLVCFSW